MHTEVVPWYAVPWYLIEGTQVVYLFTVLSGRYIVTYNADCLMITYSFKILIIFSPPSTSTFSYSHPSFHCHFPFLRLTFQTKFETHHWLYHLQLFL